jgi:hypothetical protein
MAHKNCPGCGNKKHELKACQKCGFTYSKKANVEISSTTVRILMIEKKRKANIEKRKLTPGQERNQRMGFHKGAKVPGSNIRKIDK